MGGHSDSKGDFIIIQLSDEQECCIQIRERYKANYGEILCALPGTNVLFRCAGADGNTRTQLAFNCRETDCGHIAVFAELSNTEQMDFQGVAERFLYS